MPIPFHSPFTLCLRRVWCGLVWFRAVFLSAGAVDTYIQGLTKIQTLRQICLVMESGTIPSCERKVSQNIHSAPSSRPRSDVDEKMLTLYLCSLSPREM
ncbi:hypothetical protein BDW71DRAFT_1580 [Aspergillus fruticulosus]